MLGEYGLLLGGNSLITMLSQLPDAVVNFLHTSQGQISAGILLVVLFLVFGKKN